jgi:hypothetical protein
VIVGIKYVKYATSIPNNENFYVGIAVFHVYHSTCLMQDVTDRLNGGMLD